MLAAVCPATIGFDDFHRNGVLLPGTEAAAIEAQLPLHRGPHRIYNELVLERVGTVEMEWSRNRGRCEQQARQAAQERLRLIQRGLYRRLHGDGSAPLLLNRHDPIGKGIDFAHLDNLAEQLWRASSG